MKKMLLGMICLSLNISSVIAQITNGYIISGSIKGLKDGTRIILNNVDLNKNQRVYSKNESFKINGTTEIEGEFTYLSIDGYEDAIKLFLDNQSDLKISCNVSELFTCNPTGGSKTQQQINDFEDKVQRPFSKAYKTYLTEVTKITGCKNPREFFKQIPSSLATADSLRVALALRTYQNAAITYQIATIKWICIHIDSFKSVGLIKDWWPKEGWSLIYNALSDKVKMRKSALFLKKLIENQSKTN